MGSTIEIALGRFSEKCILTRFHKKHCKNKAKYLVFNGDGTQLSNLEASPCDKHLMMVIRKTLKENKPKRKHGNPREV